MQLWWWTAKWRQVSRCRRTHRCLGQEQLGSVVSHSVCWPQWNRDGRRVEGSQRPIRVHCADASRPALRFPLFALLQRRFCINNQLQNAGVHVGRCRAKITARHAALPAPDRLGCFYRQNWHKHLRMNHCVLRKKGSRLSMLLG